MLLRPYQEPTEAEFETLPTSDQLLVMVRQGACSIEQWSGKRWEAARYVTGDLEMTPPEDSPRLRFFGSTGHEKLQLHIPATLIAQAEELTDGDPTKVWKRPSFKHGRTGHYNRHGMWLREPIPFRDSVSSAIRLFTK